MTEPTNSDNAQALSDLSTLRYQILICPECGHHATHDSDWLGDETIYCLNHENEAGRRDRPSHVLTDVVVAGDGKSAQVERIAANLGHGIAPTVEEGLGLIGRILYLRADNADLRRVVHPDNEEWCVIRKDKLEQLRAGGGSDE